MADLGEIVERFQTPLTTIIIVALVIVGGVLATRTLEFKKLENFQYQNSLSDESLAELETKQNQLNQQLNELKKQLEEAMASESSQTTTDIITSTNQSATSQSSLNSESNKKINLNSANLTQLDTLPGIGPSKAQDIVDYRNSHGSFKSIDELNNVKGIGDATLAKLKPYLTLD